MLLVWLCSSSISHNMRQHWLHREQWSGFHCFTLCVCVAPPPLLHHLLLPAFYRVSGLHFAVSPLPVHRKLASSDPHQTSCEEVGPWKTSSDREEGRRAGREALSWWVWCQVAILRLWPHAPQFLASPTIPCRRTSAQHSPIFLKSMLVCWIANNNSDWTSL